MTTKELIERIEKMTPAEIWLDGFKKGAVCMTMQNDASRDAWKMKTAAERIRAKETDSE